MNKVTITHQRAAAVPVSPLERVWAIDALRGVALFGVLAINLDTMFRVTLFEWFFLKLPVNALDRGTEIFLTFALEFKAISLFSMLFGVGLAIQFERLAPNPQRPILLARRLLALLAFGLIHLFLIWNGDILTEYAIAGLISLPLLLLVPESALLTASILLLLLYISIPWTLPSISLNLNMSWVASHVATARHVYQTGTFLDVLRFRIAEVSDVRKLLVPIFPRTLALILFGAWLWRSGSIRYLSGRRATLLVAGAVLLALGLLLTANEWGTLVLLNVGPYAPLWRHILWATMSDSAPVVAAFGYAALLLAASAFPTARKFLQFAVPVGRMAFSNYIVQSIVLSLLFYGYGLGLMGRVGTTAGLAIAVAIYTAQAVLSAWWLRSHRFGPLEWLWRTLMYGEGQPWRSGASTSAPALGPSGTAEWT